MAPRLSGFTRAASLGPIADFMDRQGGNITRVLSDVDLPFALLDQPAIVVPLREQFRFLERAARETGDCHFGARLGQAVTSPNLSAYGAWVCRGETLREAMTRAHAGLAVMLQTSTNLYVAREGTRVRWSIEFVEPETEGRHHNELLGIGYMMDVVRVYAGPKWRPHAVMTAQPRGDSRAELEFIFGTNVSHGDSTPSFTFDASLLDCGLKPAGRKQNEASADEEPKLPHENDDVATIAAVIDLAGHEDYPRIEWVAGKLGMTRRSLQRRLASHGTSFVELTEATLQRRAKALLREDERAITDIAFELGYRDPAHFTRAFRRWTGMAPTAFRAANGL
ncbi:AraC family transcriptional regulator ligand-binding domain-containing protein [Hyphomicrobium sp.]|uniref:AraC family transcriptional regulator n=1 Tax=Hyphomicrobium sp. TaxID=82 RepID=UPI002BBE0E9D|nr:AraC family transcriptional regulator ligand-binding domain-containing protein [Hyphomicrobium sp.]HRN88605.1 AraC family transcriptional regulator ligand-binding domain-containing protein [Hyphomicrobium sp.]HRQ25735.1 AraC family transcriptional regulator ligand-binding domain-containing protein [Hyphomicrobium sp.]